MTSTHQTHPGYRQRNRDLGLSVGVGVIAMAPYVSLLSNSRVAILSATIGALVALVGASTYAAIHRDSLLPPLLIYVTLAALQNVLIGPFVSKATEPQNIRLLFEVKTYFAVAMAPFMCALWLLRPQQYRRGLYNVVTLLAVSLAVMSLIWAALAPLSAPFIAKAAYVRDLAMPCILLLMAQSAVKSTGEYLYLLKWVAGIGTALALFGLVERLMLGDWFWA